jgi:chemotaxis receptor (MCP) glutamine deamidase CheD
VTVAVDKIEVDAYRVTRGGAALSCELDAAVAVCIHDDTQGVGGLLHLRFVPHSQAKPMDLTDNTLSSDLLLLDRFCKELRAEGARKQSWRVRLIGHIPTVNGMETPAATLLDLLRAYFADSRLPVECKELRRQGAVLVYLDPREGNVRVLAASHPV